MPPPSRFDGAAEWARLDPATRDAIGAMALELVTAAMGVDRHIDRRKLCRPFEAAHALLNERLETLILGHVAALAADELPVPACIGRVCRACGCSDEDGCYGQAHVMCTWVADDLCSVCAPPKEAIARFFGDSPLGEIPMGDAGSGLDLWPAVPRSLARHASPRIAYAAWWRRLTAAYGRLRPGARP